MKNPANLSESTPIRKLSCEHNSFTSTGITPACQSGFVKTALVTDTFNYESEYDTDSLPLSLLFVTIN